jgi:DegV family protein with EDD domain
MSKVTIITDTGAYLPDELAETYGIISVPFQLIWGDETYRDVVDISAEEFYTRLSTAEIMPSTSQPPPIAFEELYREKLDQGNEILSIHTSSKLSGTLDSAVQASQAFPGAPIQLVDSLTTTMQLGFLVLTAARAAQQGASLEECKVLVEQAREQSGVYFVVETLEFLRRGGRIGGGAAFLGQALDLKPILHITNGTIESAAKVRTAKKAMIRLLDLVEEQINGRKPLRICAIHANAPEKAQELLKLATERFSKYRITEAFTSGVSPAIGTHAGPGTAGIAFLAGM